MSNVSYKEVEALLKGNIKTLETELLKNKTALQALVGNVIEQHMARNGTSAHAEPPKRSVGRPRKYPPKISGRAKAASTRSLIIGFLRANPGTHATRQIAGAVGLPYKNDNDFKRVSAHISPLIKMGKVRRIQPGLFAAGR